MPERPLTQSEVTPASRRTIPAYIITSAAFGAAIFATLLRDDGSAHFSPSMLWVQDHVHLHIWWIGLGFLVSSACMLIALIQRDRWAYTLSIGGFIAWLTALGILLEIGPLTGNGTYLSGLPFLAIAYLCRVTQRSVANGDRAQPPEVSR